LSFGSAVKCCQKFAVARAECRTAKIGSICFIERPVNITRGLDDSVERHLALETCELLLAITHLGSSAAREAARLIGAEHQTGWRAHGCFA
jgi:hypothetical protein